ncbi:PLP-dependent aminotransferase family protein [Microbacterium sp. NPDC091313]
MIDPSPADLVAGLADRTPAGIAATIARRLTDGTYAPGDRLPTVRALAATLGVSPATVSSAWQALTRAGMIESRGRAGSFARSSRPGWLSSRMQHLGGRAAAPRLDLSLGTPDPALLPPLGPAFARVSLRAETGSYHDLPVIPALERVLRESWPAPVETVTVVDGALDGVGRVLEQVVRFGDRVALESPGFPYFFDLAEAIGVDPVPLALDAHGVTPASLARALVRRPAAVLLQPRAQNPTGASMTPDRARELADVIRHARDGHRVIVVEDDHSGEISSAPDATLASHLPGQVVHVRSFSKSHGPDLRIAAVGGPAALMDRVIARRMLGPGWTSRLLQAVLLDLLTDPLATAAVRRARATYRERQETLSRALAAGGVRVAAGDGINMWVPVADERAAAVRLAAQGVSVAGGEVFAAPGDALAPHVRVTVGAVTEGAAGVGRVLADAAHADAHVSATTAPAD